MAIDRVGTMNNSNKIKMLRTEQRSTPSAVRATAGDYSSPAGDAHERKSIGAKPRSAARKPGSAASSAESRLWKLAPKIFRLGGED